MEVLLQLGIIALYRNNPDENLQIKQRGSKNNARIGIEVPKFYIDLGFSWSVNWQITIGICKNSILLKGDVNCVSSRLMLTRPLI